MSWDGDCTMNEEVLQDLQKGGELLEIFKNVVVQSERSDMRPADWSAIDEAVLDYCKGVQHLNMTIGGLDEKLFDRATELLEEFVNYAEDFLSARAAEKLAPPADIKARIDGVIARCKARIVELDSKRSDIALVEEKIEAITGCHES